MKDAMSKYWKTATGAIIPIEKMSDPHLANAINFLRRRLATRPLGPDRKKLLNARIRVLLDEQSRRQKPKVPGRRKIVLE